MITEILKQVEEGISTEELRDMLEELAHDYYWKGYNDALKEEKYEMVDDDFVSPVGVDGLWED